MNYKIITWIFAFVLLITSTFAAVCYPQDCIDSGRCIFWDKLDNTSKVSTFGTSPTWSVSNNVLLHEGTGNSRVGWNISTPHTGDINGNLTIEFDYQRSITGFSHNMVFGQPGTDWSANSVIFGRGGQVINELNYFNKTAGPHAIFTGVEINTWLHAKITMNFPSETFNSLRNDTEQNNGLQFRSSQTSFVIFGNQFEAGSYRIANISIINGTDCIVAPPPTANFTVTAENSVTSATLTTFNVTLNGTHYTTTSGQVNTTIPEASGLFDFNVSAIGFYPNRTFGWDTTLNILASLKPFSLEFLSQNPANNSIFNVSTVEFNLTFRYNGTPTSTSCNLTIDSANSFSGSTSLNETITLNTTVSGLTDTDHFYNWTCTNQYLTFNSPTFKTSTDTVLPVVNVTAPPSNFTYLLNGQSLVLNWTATDVGLGLDKCWFIYNGVNTNLTCFTNTTTFTYATGINNITFFANDTAGNEVNDFKPWGVKLVEIEQIFTNETTEGSLETFLANIMLGDGFTISSLNFIYNGSNSSGSFIISGDNITLDKTDFLVPDVGSETNFTFTWNVTISDSTEIELSQQTQRVFGFNIDDCSAGTIAVYNFSVVDEETQVVLPNATVETAITFFDHQRTHIVNTYNRTFTNTNPVSICINQALANSTKYSVDVIIRYENVDHANEYFNILNSTYIYNTSVLPITLFDLNLNESTEFQLTFTGPNFLPVENALVFVDRQYISENQFKTVELPKTDFNGQSVLHLVRNDVIYNIRIVKDGKILGNFENLVAFCDDFTIGDCNIELNAFDSVENIFNFNAALGIIFDPPSYNSTTNKVSFSFVTTDGNAKSVTLNVSRNDIFGNRTICISNLISSGGTLSCDIDPAIEDTSLKADVYVNGVLVVYGSVDLDDTNFGVAGYLIVFVLVLSMILIFGDSKTGVLVSMIISFAGAIGLGLLSSDIIGIGASGLWFLVIVIIGIYKLNSGRPQ